MGGLCLACLEKLFENSTGTTSEIFVGGLRLIECLRIHILIQCIVQNEYDLNSDLF
jgi:hypothetical protein